MHVGDPDELGVGPLELATCRTADEGGAGDDVGEARGHLVGDLGVGRVQVHQRYLVRHLVPSQRRPARSAHGGRDVPILHRFPIRWRPGENGAVTDSPAGDPARLRVLWFAGVSWDAVRGTDQRAASAVAERADVLYVDPPLPLHRRPRPRSLPAARPLSAGMERLTPRSPPRRLPPRRQGDDLRPAAAAGRHCLGGRRPDVVLATCLDDVLGTVPAARRILVGTDDYVAGAALMGQPAARLARDERRQLAVADVVTAVTPALARRWEEVSGRPVVLLPNGCDVDHYAAVDEAPVPAVPDLPSPVAGLVGTISERIDIGLLEAVAATGMGLLLVGPRRSSFAPGRFERLVAQPGVHWAGPQPYAALPGYLRLMDVGLTPYVDDAFNRASYPLKTLEYLAAGRPVVSTPLPAAVGLGTDLVLLGAGAGAFVQGVRAAALQASDPRLVRARRAFASTHSWRARADQLMSLFDTPPTTPGRSAPR